MNQPNSPAKPPSLPAALSPAPPEPEADPFVPMTGDPTVSNTFDTLLKKPGSVLHELRHGERPGRVVGNLVFVAVVCLAVFGLVIGCFSGGSQLWAAPVKVVFGTLAAALISLPSLYVFSCLNGLDVNARLVGGVLSAALCLMALLLLGFAPVAWIFSQSIASSAFMGFIALVFWLISMGIGLGLVFRTARMLGVRKSAHLALWCLMFAVVTLQMSTTLRPIVEKSDRFFTTEKKFFLAHWFGVLDSEEERENARGWER